MKPLKIFWFPHGSRNPYQQLLIKGLKTFGLTIRLTETRKFLFCDISILNILYTNWKPDFIHLHWHHSSLVTSTKFKSIVKSLVFIFQIYILKLLRINFIWTIHNLTHHEDKQKQIELFFCQILGNLANAIITHCEIAQIEVANIFKIRNSKKIHVIPHGNYINFYENNISKEKAKIKLLQPQHSFNFLFLGEIRPYKGIKLLISSFQKIENTENLSMSLIIAGRPKSRRFIKEIKRLIKGNKNINLVLNYISDNEIQVYLNAADIMVFPYRDVFTSGSILLAMSFGKPIIAPRIGCIKDVLDDSGSFLYDLGHSNELHEIMKKAVLEKSQLQQMGCHNLNLAKRFSWVNIAEATKDLYLSLIKI
jgi:glycosyltransferase involved in cell wall biosynthesis